MGTSSLLHGTWGGSCAQHRSELSYYNHAARKYQRYVDSLFILENAQD